MAAPTITQMRKAGKEYREAGNRLDTAVTAAARSFTVSRVAHYKTVMGPVGVKIKALQEGPRTQGQAPEYDSDEDRPFKRRAAAARGSGRVQPHADEDLGDKDSPWSFKH